MNQNRRFLIVIPIVVLLIWIRPAANPMVTSPKPLQVSEWVNPCKEGTNLEALRGRVVLLHFWATWWGPCNQEIPELIALKEKYEAQGLTIIGVSGESTELVEAFAKEHKIPYSLAIDNDFQTHKAYNIQYYPTNYLIGADGEIFSIGYTVNMIEKALEKVKNKDQDVTQDKK